MADGRLCNESFSICLYRIPTESVQSHKLSPPVGHHKERGQEGSWRRKASRDQAVWECGVWASELCGTDGNRTGESNDVPAIMS